jgi:hypothetical protein
MSSNFKQDKETFVQEFYCDKPISEELCFNHYLHLYTKCIKAKYENNNIENITQCEEFILEYMKKCSPYKKDYLHSSRQK